MKIEIELWTLYFFEARNNPEALLGLWNMFSKVSREYPLVEAFTIKAVFNGYMTLNQVKNGNR